MTTILEPHLSVTGKIGVFRSELEGMTHKLQVFHGPCSYLIEDAPHGGFAECTRCGQKWYRSYLATWDLNKSTDPKEIKHWVACWTELHPIEIQVVVS